MPFKELGLSPKICLALARLEYTQPTPIQAKAIPLILSGHDLLACAQTGTGKTAAFALPMLERLFPAVQAARPAPRKVRALILTPTRELASQVHETLRACGQHTPLRSTEIFGGVGVKPQIVSLAQGVDAVVATPGRLIDHMRQRTIDLSAVEILVLDEADRLLDMGFLPDLRRILGALPRQRQTLLFSATLTPEVKKLSADFTRQPVEVRMTVENRVAEKVSHRVHRVDDEKKRDFLLGLLRSEDDQTLVFCRTKRGTDRLCRHLRASGIQAEAIHGDRSQAARTAALAGFKARRMSVLVATDIAARGLDIEQLPLVINFDLPMVANDYIHRVGRSGRAGAAGRAISLVGNRDEEMLREIERLLAFKIETAPAVSRALGISSPLASVRPGTPQRRTPPRSEDRRGGGASKGGRRAGGRQADRSRHRQGSGHSESVVAAGAREGAPRSDATRRLNRYDSSQWLERFV